MVQDPIIFSCNFCQQSFLNFKRLLKHLNNHSDSDFCCGVDNCSLVFHNLNSLKEHLNEFHNYVFKPIVSNISLSESSFFTITKTNSN